MTRIQFVVSCTDRKKRSVPESSRLGSVDTSNLVDRVAAWRDQLRGSEGSSVPCRDLYGGEHWVEFLRILDETDEATGWVVSAGYGLLSLTDEVNPYMATFSRGHADSVCPQDAEWNESDWWTELCQNNALEASRSLGGLDADAGIILIAASPTYLNAMRRDLEVLIRGRSPESVCIFSAGSPDLGEVISPAVVPFDARLQQVFGGSRIGLNVRAMAYAVRNSPVVNSSEIRHAIESIMERTLPSPIIDRSKASDQEVQGFIRMALRETPDAMASPLLRQWRTGGRACEQGRFRELYLEVRQESHESETRDALESSLS